MPYIVKAQRASDTDKPPTYESVGDDEVISQKRRLRSSETDTYYHQSPLTKTGSQDLSYPPVFDDNTAEMHELGLAEARERTKVEYREEQTPERTEIGAVGGSDSSSTKSRALIKLRASRLARLRDSSADSATSTTAKDTGVEAATDPAASSRVGQQPEPTAPLGELTDQLGPQQPPPSQVQVAYNPQNPQPVDQGGNPVPFDAQAQPVAQPVVQPAAQLVAQPVVQPAVQQIDGQIDGQAQQIAQPAAGPVQPAQLNSDQDSDSEMETGHNSIYPPNFKGTTSEDAEAWLRHFKNYCAYKDFTDDKIRALFRVMLVDSAAVWFDSLTQAKRDDWEALKAEFLKRYTTPEFLKYKHANDLFNCKQETKSVDDYTAFMQKLASQIGAHDDILRFAVINGLRPEIKNHVTMQQPSSWEALVEAARVGEMCSPVVTQTDPNVALQIELMRDQLNQLAVDKRVAAIDGLNRPNGPSRSSSERRVRFNNDSDGEYERGRSLSPVPRRRDDRRGDWRGDSRGDWRDSRGEGLTTGRRDDR